MDFERIAVAGTGLMGPGIAAIFAMSGRSVTMVSRRQETAEAGVQTALGLVGWLADNGVVSPDTVAAVSRGMTTSCDPEATVREVDLFVESIAEDLAIKREYFARLDRASPDAVLCSNTSGISITAIAEGCHNPSRVFTTHFWNPPHLMPLVEVVMGEKSDRPLAIRLLELLRECGKTAVLVQKDVPGQLGNRIQHAMIRECMHIVAEGIASPEDVDLAVKAGFGLRTPVYGVFEHADMVGLDLVKAVQDVVVPDLSTAPKATPIHDEKVRSGNLGVKTGSGFLDWPEGAPERVRARRDAFVLEFLKMQKAGAFD